MTATTAQMLDPILEALERHGATDALRQDIAAALKWARRPRKQNPRNRRIVVLLTADELAQVRELRETRKLGHGDIFRAGLDAMATASRAVVDAWATCSDMCRGDERGRAWPSPDEWDPFAEN